MDVQLQELIEKIKQDGLETATTEAAAVRAAAEAEAARIVERARAEAADLTVKAQADAKRAEQAGAAALSQAARNLVLEFRGEIERLLGKVVQRETAAALDAEVLKSTLPDLLKAWSAKGGDLLDVILPEADLAKLEAFFAAKLAAELKSGVVLKPARSLSAGFRIVAKDGSAYYDFSAAAVAELLSGYLNPRLAVLLKTAAQGL